MKRTVCTVAFMVGARLNAIVHGPIQRTYLEHIDGYWADLVLREFEFLEDRGGTLDAVSFHFKGDYIIYNGPWGKVTFSFAPDNLPGGQIGAEAIFHGAGATFEGDLNRLVRRRTGRSVPPIREEIDRAAIVERLGLWSAVLRASEDLFRA